MTEFPASHSASNQPGVCRKRRRGNTRLHKLAPELRWGSRHLRPRPDSRCRQILDRLSGRGASILVYSDSRTEYTFLLYVCTIMCNWNIEYLVKQHGHRNKILQGTRKTFQAQSFYCSNLLITRNDI